MAVTLVYDATTGNIGYIPGGQAAAGYTTGQGIAWSSAEWAAHPGAVRIDQDPSARDPTADILDVEDQAATAAEGPGWVRAAQDNRAKGARPGQRAPAIYMNGSTVTSVVNALIAGGVTSGVGLWVARPGLPQAQATVQVAGGAGPFPIIGVQYYWGPHFDISVFSTAWLGTVPSPPTGWTQALIAELGTLSNGSTGDDVRSAQSLLNARGYSCKIDGDYGPATIAAIRRFQGDNGLSVDGVAGQQTWTKLHSR